jgi:phage major head subunit gpT-like protein
MDITFPGLQSINDAVTMRFNEQLYAAPSIYKLFSLVMNSDGDSEIYPRLDMLPGLREWVGERVVYSLSQETFTIKNKTFEETISVRREQLEDDRYGLLAPAAAQLGQDAGYLPDKLIASLMAGGTTILGVDGQPFFDTSHPSFPNTNLPGVNSNYLNAGEGPSWYLIDNSHVLKPFVYQSRRPFKITTKFSMEDPSVFFNDEFIWGVDGRCNAGLGLYQLIFRVDGPLTLANLISARTAMAAWKRPDGTPMGITPTHLVVPPSLYPTAKAYQLNDYDPNPPEVTSLVVNTFKGMITAVEDKWLS